jgi:prolipoprotein diacylglyceryl transferase
MTGAPLSSVASGPIASLATVLASIPSPSSNQITIGPLHLRAYGLMIALGVFAAIEIARRRWRARGGDPEDMSAIALWAVPAGLIGARIYHVITDNELYRGHWFDNPFASGSHSPLMIWNGGLGIPGGLALGLLVGVWVASRRGIHLAIGVDAVAPGVAVAQAIGRLGNWFNQELFGRPTSLPWGLRIDLANRQVGYEQFTTFHPTFLYEALWNLALAGLLVLLDRRKVVRPGRIFALYVGGYGLGRFLVESLRIDNANRILGLRVNIWTSIIAFVGIALFLAIRGLKRRPGDSYEPYLDGHRFGEDAPADDAEAADVETDPEADRDVDEVPDADEITDADEVGERESAGEQGS